MAIPYNSNYDETVPFSDVCWQVALNSNSAQSFTVPGGPTNNYQIQFGYNDTANVFVGKNTTPTVPAGGTTNTQQYVECRPKKRYVVGGDVISFITPDTTAYFGVSLRAIP